MSQQLSLRGGRNRKFKSEINVVPYIDVMLVLLVIFMVVAPITAPNVINLPTSGRSALPRLHHRRHHQRREAEGHRHRLPAGRWCLAGATTRLVSCTS